MIKSFLKRLIRRFPRIPSDMHRVTGVESYVAYLRSRGCSIGSNVSIIGNARVDDNHCWHISIGNDVTIAPGAYVLAHDASTKHLTGYTWVAAVRIEDGVFIGAHAVILPGVTIGASAIIGAGAVVTTDVLPGTIVAGVPAREIGNVDQYQALHRYQLSTYPRFNSSFTTEREVSLEMRRSMAETISAAGGGYVE